MAKKKKGGLKRGDRVEIVRENDHLKRIGKRGTVVGYASGGDVWVRLGFFGSICSFSRNEIKKV